MDTTRRQAHSLVGSVLDQRYVLVEATSLEAPEARFVSYDMQKLSHVEIIVPLDAGDLCTERFRRADEERQTPTKPTREEREASPLLRMLHARHQARMAKARAVLSDSTVQLTEADLMEVGLFDACRTIQLLESELIDVVDDPSPPLVQPGDDADESQLRLLLRRRLWIGWGAAVALMVVIAVAWMSLTRAEVAAPEPPQTVPSAANVPTRNVVAANVPAANVPVANVPAANVPTLDATPTPTKKPMADSVSVVVETKTRRRRYHMPRHRPVDPDAILASARSKRPIMQSTVNPFH